MTYIKQNNNNHKIAYSELKLLLSHHSIIQSFIIIHEFAYFGQSLLPPLRLYQQVQSLAQVQALHLRALDQLLRLVLESDHLHDVQLILLLLDVPQVEPLQVVLYTS